MRANIHAKYYSDAKVICACGNSFTTGSTQPEIKVDICSNCPPYYTGEQRFVDIQGRVEKFQAKMKAAVVAPRPKKISRQPQVATATPLSLKEMLKGRSATESATGRK